MKVNDKGILIDGIDKKILRALMKDARTPILEIARTCWYFWSCNSSTSYEN